MHDLQNGNFARIDYSKIYSMNIKSTDEYSANDVEIEQNLSKIGSRSVYF